jgi:hypothetical protein
MSIDSDLKSVVSCFKSVDFFKKSVVPNLESYVSLFKSVDFFFMSVDSEFRTVDSGKEIVHFDPGTRVLNIRTIVKPQGIVFFFRIPHGFTVILYFLPDIIVFTG